MYSVRQVARSLSISDTAVRQWTNEFSEHLSEYANVPKGKTRQYTDEDFDTFQTVSVLRSQGKSYDEIHKELQAGTRLEPTGDAYQAPNRPPPKESDTALAISAFSAALSTYESRLTRAENKLEETTERLLEAEKRATKAETELEILKEQLSPKDDTEGEKRPFWKRFRH